MGTTSGTWRVSPDRDGRQVVYGGRSQLGMVGGGTVPSTGGTTTFSPPPLRLRHRRRPPVNSFSLRFVQISPVGPSLHRPPSPPFAVADARDDRRRRLRAPAARTEAVDFPYLVKPSPVRTPHQARQSPISRSGRRGPL